MLPQSTTDRPQAELWRRYASPDHPAEWDGPHYGGGRLSQRFWEYLRAVELMNLDSRSVILDIGGGSPLTGVGFFSSLLSTQARRVIVMDPSIKAEALPPDNVEFDRSAATYDGLKALLVARPEVTHIVTISVFEHIRPSIRQGMLRAITSSSRATRSWRHSSITPGLVLRTRAHGQDDFRPLQDVHPLLPRRPVGFAGLVRERF